MLMRPAPPRATGTSPITYTHGPSCNLHCRETRTERVKPAAGLRRGQSLRVTGARIQSGQPYPTPPPSTTRDLFHPAYTGTGEREPPEGSSRQTEPGDGFPSPWDQVEGLGALTVSRNVNRPFPRRSGIGILPRTRCGGGINTWRKIPSRIEEPSQDAENRYRGGSGLHEIPDPSDRRVPFHAAFADDPAFHRPDQEVVADDNTEENHRRRLPPDRSDNFSHYEKDPENRHDEIPILPQIATPDTDAGRIQGSRHRQRRKPDILLGATASSISQEDSDEETKEKEQEQEVSSTEKRHHDYGYDYGYDIGESRQVDSENAKVSKVTKVDEVAKVAEVTDVAQAREVTRSERRRFHFRKGRRRGSDDKTFSSLFVLYLLALPILCATSGSPPGDRGPATFSRNGRNSSGDVEERNHPYRDYSWEVNQINPWLSACDLAGPAPADLQGSCGPPETPRNCPDACRKTDTRASRAADSFFAVVNQAKVNRGGEAGGVPRQDTGGRTAPEQCLFYLEESHKTEICRDDFGKESSTGRSSTVQENRYRFLSGLRLRHCCEHAALNALASGDGGPLEEVLGGNEGCRKAIGKLLAVDALAARLHCEFGEVLARYDCGQPYSVIYNCSHCKEAYRRWVCSSLVPYFAHDDHPRQKKQGLAGPRMGTGMRIRPCRSFCQTVEQRCPYLLPGDRAPAYPTQYAGEPTFLCRDPNIPETGEQASRALHADEECCFHVCSDEDPGRGVCANCTEPQVEIAIRGGNAHRDPSTAPQCEINSASSASGQHQSTTSSTTDSGLPVHPKTSDEGVGDTEIPGAGTSHHSSSSSSSSSYSSSGASFCGSGGVGSMSSSAGPRVAPPSIKMCAFCAWGALLGVCTIKVASSWTTIESSLFEGPVHNPCSVELIKRVNRHRNRIRSILRSPPANTIYLVIFSCSLIRSILIGIRDFINELIISIAFKDLFEVILNRRYKYNNNVRDYLLLHSPIDYIEAYRRRSSVYYYYYNNRGQGRRRHRPGGKRRRENKRRRAS